MNTIDDHEYIEGVGLYVPYVLTRKFKWDGSTEKQEPMYNIRDVGVWRLMMFHSKGRHFFLSFSFVASRQAFVIFIIVPDIPSVADTFRATITFEESECINPGKITFQQELVSLDNIQDVEEELPSSKYLVIPYEDTKRFFLYTANDDSDIYPDENGKFTIAVPLQIAEIQIIGEEQS